jgi:small-conductance mechanosensitive channel
MTPHSEFATLAAAAHRSDWLKALIYLAGTVILARVADYLLARQGGGLSRVLRRELTVAAKTRLRMVRRLAVFGILFVGIAFALVQLPQVGTLARGMLASAGITALVIGLAARSVLANLVSGIIIAFSQPVRIGDYVSVDDEQGLVEEIGLTYTYIRTPDERRLVIPNDLFASKVIHNYSIVDPVNAVAVDLVLPLSTDVDAVRRAALEEAGRAAPALEGYPPAVEIVAQTVDSMTLRLTVWLADPALRLATERALRLAMLQRLKTAGFITGPPPDAA